MDEDLPLLGAAAASSPPSAAVAGPGTTSTFHPGVGFPLPATPTAPPPPAPPEPPLWPPAAQVAVAVLLTLALGLLTWHVLAAQPWLTRPTTLEPGDLRLDLNQADQAQLRQLPGVGENLAERILERRRQLGGFRRLEDLRQVKGIGPAILERLRPNVRIGPYHEVEDPPEEDDPPPPRVVRGARPDAPVAPPPAPRSTRKVTPKQPIDINRANLEELKTLPGIGPTLAARILEARQQKPFASVQDLRKVKGIGVKTLEGLRPFVSTGNTSDDNDPSR